MVNKLTSLHHSIGLLQDLLELSLAKNQLTKLPESIDVLRNLQALSIMGNKIRQLPASSSSLKNLQKLYLGWNQLISLPEAVVDLDELSDVWIDKSMFNNLPERVKIFLKKNSFVSYMKEYKKKQLYFFRSGRKEELINNEYGRNDNCKICNWFTFKTFSSL
ncbi:MAG: leucine-rich repeat domain-containing protein [Promethearchaeota archaeon]